MRSLILIAILTQLHQPWGKLTKIRKKECFKKFQDFAKTPGKEDKILKNFDVIAPYVKQMRGF